MKAKEQRKLRGYKIADTPYEKAKKRGNGLLATLVESWVIAYGQGATILVNPPEKNKTSKR